MRLLALLLSSLLLPGLSEAATKVPNRDFTLSVTVSYNDLVSSYGELVDYDTFELIEEYEVDEIGASFFFDSTSGDYYNITGTILEGDLGLYSYFTYDFATKRGSRESNIYSGYSEFSFAVGEGAYYYHDFDDGFGWHIGRASWSDVTVNLTLAPVPLPAGLPLLAAGLGVLTLMRRRKKG